MRKDELYHFGIKGQKKGLRRFQYANKSYTPEGNRRYRPSKGESPLVKAAIAGSAAAFVWQGSKAIAKATAGGVSMSAKMAAIGKAAVAAAMSVPAPIFALTLPLATAAVIAGTVAANEALKALKDEIF